MAKLNILEHSNICDYFPNATSKVKVEAILEKEDICPNRVYIISVCVGGISKNRVHYSNYVTDYRCNFRTDSDSIRKLMRVACMCDLEFELPKNLDIDSIEINLNGFEWDEYDPTIPDIFTWKNHASAKIPLKEKEGDKA